jgi:hypothetical protein
VNLTVSRAWTPSRGRSRKGAGVALMFVVGGVATAAAAVAANGNIVVAVAPVLAAVCVSVIFATPIRYLLFGLTFLCLALDVPGEGPWDSPVAPLGGLLATNLDKSSPLPIPVPGAIILIAFFFLLHVHRSLSGSTIDATGRTETASPLIGSVAVSLFGVLAICAWGFIRGGDPRMARVQVMNYVVLLGLAYLSAISFRNLRDYRHLGRLIVAAACIKAVNAWYVSNTRLSVFPEYATSHGDSVLFACATVILLIWCAEKPARQGVIWSLILLPLLVVGMVANDRRLVWVEIIGVLAMYWMISRRTQVKRFLAPLLLAATPLFAAYVIVGWDSQAGIFAPIQTYRSVTGSDGDGSTLYRDTENYNLLMTLRGNPFLGTGFGHAFTEVIKLPDISFFREYGFFPHNSILGLWAFTGAFGFTALFVVFVAAVYFAALAYSSARTPEERIAAFMVPAFIMIHAAQCWGDIGFSERKSSYLVGPALAMAGQLAVITGAWRARLPRTTGTQRTSHVVG